MAYQIELITLHCVDAQEGWSDPWLLVNGQIQWGPTLMQTGDIRTIGRLITFNRHISIELRDSDTEKWPPQTGDHVGELNLCESEVKRLICGYQGGGLVAEFHCNGGANGDATYRLTYELDEE